MKISAIRKNSLASRAGLKIGDELVQINHQPVRDEIDYAFHASDESIVLSMERRSQPFDVVIEKEIDQDTGLHFEPTEFRCCNNHCIFCFIDQLPAGLRTTLYLKDEDYRLSFLHGSYITLTNISDDDLHRISEQRLSPLYISVHATEPSLRERIIRGKGAGDVLEKIASLANAHIEMHTQVVLCPGINDGPHLEQTIKDLWPFFPYVQSLAIVPVGLTRHRQGQPGITGVDPESAAEVIRQTEPHRHFFRHASGRTFLHCADEFYFLAGMDIPEAEWYDDFPQIENGVGMVRRFLDTFSERKAELPGKIAAPMNITLVSGMSACGFLIRHVMPVLTRIENLQVDLVPVVNTFLGHSVTVSGLLSGKDILRTLESLPRSDVTLLPPNCLNEDGLFLDNLTLNNLKQKLNSHVVIGDYDIIGSLLELFQMNREKTT